MKAAKNKVKKVIPNSLKDKRELQKTIDRVKNVVLFEEKLNSVKKSFENINNQNSILKTDCST